jgi:flagellar biosynthesis protein FlhB
MAEDQAQRTEEPTPRRKQRARDEGQVASSRDLTAALQFLASVILLMAFAPGVVAGIVRTMRGLLRAAFKPSIERGDFEGLGAAALNDSLSFLWSFGATLLVVGLTVHMAQTGFALSAKRLTPDFKRLNPLEKLKQIPGENLAQTFKALLLIPFATAILVYVISSEMTGLMKLPRMSFAAAAGSVGETILALLLKAALGLALLAVWDLYRQRRKVHKRLMMSKHEVRQEYKDIEGNPLVKGRLRRLQREFARRRMMSEVPKATVVVANPTHFAVAIRYQPEKMAAPVVVAKGVDFLALRIRHVAEQHQVAVVENPPLARALYKSAEIGTEIPMDLYRAVAEILAYIYKLRGERPF